MSNANDNLRERLLGEHAPEPDKLARYRKETQAMLDREERRMRWFGRYTAAIWLMLVAMGTMYALVAGWSREQPMKVYFSIGVMLLVLLIGGAVQLVAGFLGRARLEVAKDIKGLELRILELEALIRERNR
jgi:hypothetical protein